MVTRKVVSVIFEATSTGTVSYYIYMIKLISVHNIMINTITTSMDSALKIAIAMQKNTLKKMEKLKKRFSCQIIIAKTKL